MKFRELGQTAKKNAIHTLMFQLNSDEVLSAPQSKEDLQSIKKQLFKDTHTKLMASRVEFTKEGVLKHHRDAY